jgi:rhamnose transport system permease protein
MTRPRPPTWSEATTVLEVGVTASTGPAGSRAAWLAPLARQRELSLVAVMLVLGALVALTAPQFLTVSNLSQVAVLASITAVAAVGEGLVIITRNVDLSVEAMMGLVAYSVASLLERHALDAGPAIVFGIGLGLVLGMINGVIVTRLNVPAIVATLGTLSIFRGVDYLVAGSHQVPLAGLPEGFTDPARDTVLGIPDFVLVTLVVVIVATVVLRSTRFGRQLYAVGSNPEAAAVLGIPSRLVVFVAFSMCGLLAGVAGVLFVMEFGTINGTSATGLSLAVVAAVVVGGVNIFGGTGTVAGAVLGALFLGFIANALILVGLSQFWLQAIYGLVILIAVAADAIILRRIKRASVRRGTR